ncbi:RmlC-like cupin domain-containing protein [Dichotomopilus funicola]|uniref:RmlC-like cupin domain-containing protein n=1 Tax=Dichotomopilus funicola TaxID=1934379 RepID=A0AAN6UX70_9PEZI|nr:RmlC-like cupin domain-containing protein [Dichotomopilus funicola]
MAPLQTLLTLCLGLSTALAVPSPSPDNVNININNNHNNKPINQRTAQEIITHLNLIPNAEKGYYVESFRDLTTNVTTTNTPTPITPRAASTAIYYLLEGRDGHSNWHRVTDAAEVWHYYAGAPLTLELALDDGSPVREVVLGPDLFAGDGTTQRPQAVVAKGEWQRARSWGAWTLVGTTVAPGFDPNGGFELADPGWVPNA